MARGLGEGGLARGTFEAKTAVGGEAAAQRQHFDRTDVFQAEAGELRDGQVQGAGIGQAENSEMGELQVIGIVAQSGLGDVEGAEKLAVAEH